MEQRVGSLNDVPWDSYLPPPNVFSLLPGLYQCKAAVLQVWSLDQQQWHHLWAGEKFNLTNLLKQELWGCCLGNCFHTPSRWVLCTLKFEDHFLERLRLTKNLTFRPAKDSACIPSWRKPCQEGLIRNHLEGRDGQRQPSFHGFWPLLTLFPLHEMLFSLCPQELPLTLQVPTHVTSSDFPNFPGKSNHFVLHALSALCSVPCPSISLIITYQFHHLFPCHDRSCVLFIFTSLVSSPSICGNKSNSAINKSKRTLWKARWGKRLKVFYRKTRPLLNEFLVTRLNSQASCWPQTPSVSVLSVGGASCTPIRAKRWHSGISLQRQQHSNLPGAVWTVSHWVSGGCGWYTPSRLCFSVIITKGSESRADGGGRGMFSRGSQIHNHTFQFMSSP